MGNPTGNPNTDGTIFAVILIAAFLILAAIFLPISADWKLCLGLAGFSIILFLVAGALYKSFWIFGIIVFLLALVAAGFSVHFFSVAANALIK
ncbi:MAG: hypothetical protein NTY79_01195 [Chloroflexi bacterium]|nr:hypothetical protein [Chloroflexota bacterium]